MPSLFNKVPSHNTSSVAKNEHSGCTSLRMVHIFFLLFSTATLYLADANNLLIGANDLYHGRHSVTFASFLDWNLDDVTSLETVLYKFLLIGHALGFYAHGPIPPLFIGIFYRILDFIGVPFSVFVLQMPTALFAISAVILFYLALAHAKLDLWIAFFAALVLAFSPIFTVSARGLSTYWAVIIVFNQALALYTFQRIDGSRKSKIILSAVIAHILLSDMLSILSLLALVVGYALRSYEWRFTPKLPLQLLSHIWKNLSFLSNAIIMIPNAVVFLFLAGTAVVAITIGQAGGIPLYPTLIFWTLTAHGGELILGQSLDLDVWYTRIIHALGEIAPFMVVAALLVLILFRKGCNRGFIWSFAWIASLGFGILFYVLADDHPTSLYLDQMYIVIPFIAFTAYQFDRMRRNYAWGRVFGRVGLGAISVGALTSTITLTWSIPVSLASNRLIVDQQSNSWHDAIGFKVPNVGTRAAGYIARSQLLQAWRSNPELHVTLTHASTWHPRTYVPFQAYAGLFQKGDWFANELGIKPRITYRQVLPNSTLSSKAVCKDAKLCISQTSTESYAVEHIPLTPATMPPCKAPFCVSLTIGDTAAPVYRYAFYDHDKLWQVLYVQSSGEPSLPPGRYQIDDLDRRFEATYARLWDYFPKRPAYRIKGFANNLLSKF